MEKIVKDLQKLGWEQTAENRFTKLHKHADKHAHIEIKENNAFVLYVFEKERCIVGWVIQHNGTVESMYTAVKARLGNDAWFLQVDTPVSRSKAEELAFEVGEILWESKQYKEDAIAQVCDRQGYETEIRTLIRRYRNRGSIGLLRLVEDILRLGQ